MLCYTVTSYIGGIVERAACIVERAMLYSNTLCYTVTRYEVLLA